MCGYGADASVRTRVENLQTQKSPASSNTPGCGGFSVAGQRQFPKPRDISDIIVSLLSSLNLAHSPARCFIAAASSSSMAISTARTARARSALLFSRRAKDFFISVEIFSCIS